MRRTWEGNTPSVTGHWSTLNERIRGSLFFVPLVGVLGGAGSALGLVAVDSRIDSRQADLPLGLASTVESARTLLSTVASATITFAGIAFSISLLVIQQAASQHSPRVVHALFREPFNKRVMALVLGTFTYCLLVLRSVRSPLEDGGQPVIPTVSVAVAVLLGVVAILAVVAFINHSAHSMDISQILERAQREAARPVRDPWGAAHQPPTSPTAPDGEPQTVVRFDRSGWIQHVDAHRLLASLAPGATAELATYPGRYAVPGSVAVHVWGAPPPDDAVETLRHSITLGASRTMLQDPSYGIRALVDVALRALSPGVNDPTTAQDAIFHSAAALVTVLEQPPPPPVLEGEKGRRLLLPELPTDGDLVRLAFEEVRRAAAPHPTVSIYVLEALALVRDAAPADRPEVASLLTAQAALLVDGCEAAGLVPADLVAVRHAWASRFGPTRPAAA